MNTPLVPFQAGSPIMIAGPTGSGKTFWTNKLLKNQMFSEPVSSVLYCYGVYQTYYDKMEIPNLELHEGLPSLDKVQSLNDGKFHVIVLDDLMEYIVKSVETQNLFTKYCHHYNITAIKMFLHKDLALEQLVLIHIFWYFLPIKEMNHKL